jgi:hypothetical protein
VPDLKALAEIDQKSIEELSVEPGRKPRIYTQLFYEYEGQSEPE